MLDDFSSDRPEDYAQGFPAHPHRGIETITYILRGEMEHRDSLGNRGVIGPGGVQWMTAGSGIIHQEMPQGDAEGGLVGFQLWANLPAAQKMRDPRYQNIEASQIPEVAMENGGRVRVIAGRVDDRRGPVQGVVIEPEYLDVSLPADARFAHLTRRGHTVFAYVIEGEAHFGPPDDAFESSRTARPAQKVGRHGLVLFEDGDQVMASTGDGPTRFLLISGEPLREPVAWRGLIVMNSEEEVHAALKEYRSGTFVKHKAEPLR